MNNELTEKNAEPIVERPRFKTRRRDSHLEMVVSLPGVERESVSLKVEKRWLTISGNRPEIRNFESSDNEARQYQLKVELHEDLDPEAIEAKLHDGLLVLKLQKRKELEPRKIEILTD